MLRQTVLFGGIKLDGPNQLWVADITYVTIETGFVYLGAILDAWSRRVVGYAISRSIDARLVVAALKAAIRLVCLRFFGIILLLTVGRQAFASPRCTAHHVDSRPSRCHGSAAPAHGAGKAMLL